MAIRVPVNPDTNPGSVIVPFTPEGRGRIGGNNALAQGLSDLGQSIENVRKRQAEELRKQDQFVATNKFIEVNNQWQQDFAARQTSPDLLPGAPGFADSVNQDFTAQREKLIAEAQAAGMDKDVLRQFDHNLGMAQNQYLGQAVSFQQQQAKVHGISQLGDLDKNLSVHVLNNPNDVNQAL